MQTFQELQRQVRERFINSEAERSAQEVSSLLDELVAAVGVDRMTDTLRLYGYNVEPSQQARQRAIA